MVLRIGKEEIDFLFFKKGGAGIEILSYGSENISSFNVRQTLEKMFMHLPQKEIVGELIVTFQAHEFRAQLIGQTLIPSSSLHLLDLDKGEALSIERDILARAERAFQKNIFYESGILPNEFSLRRVKILERRINGYSVPKLEGFKSGAIEFSILGMFLLESSFLPVEQFAKAHKINSVRVIHIAEALEAFTRKYHQKGIYLCVEEEKTQIAIQNEEHFMFLGTIPMGASNFTEFFADMLGMREATARAFEEQYFNDGLSVAVQEKVQTFLLPEIQKFGTLVKKKILEAKITLPEFFWVFGKGRSLGNLQSFFAQDLLDDLPFSQNPKMNFLMPKDVWEAKNFPGANDPLNTMLCLFGAFAFNPR